jgi:hypothetical protein
MPSDSFQDVFNHWADAALAEPIPDNTVAFSFNLAEPWCIEVIGAERYSEDDPDWACDEVFRPKAPNLDLPRQEAGTSWEPVLEAAKSLVLNYLSRESVGASRLKQSEAVAIGFVDGDLHMLWSKSGDGLSG